MKLGSLFDGSGGFPLAGALCDIEPVWASEIEPYPIAVTRSRFPNMKHLGDISKINGAEIEPVDVITFGSPCQDLSVAGRQAGLKHTDNGDEETTRSGLFMEAVRIIKEMRNATNGKYPRFALWENVPGAFSSNKGEDFKVVLEELIKIVEPSAPLPSVPKRGWNYADSYIGDGWSLAYRVFDAQFWGVPQRRRRIYLVLDLGGERAREVLFEREGLRWYFAEGRTPWQRASADAERSPDADDREGDSFEGDRGRQMPDVIGADLFNASLTGGVSATIGCNCKNPNGSTGVVYSVENHPNDSRVRIGEDGKVQALTSRMGTGGGNVPMVMEPFCKSTRARSADDATTRVPGKVANTLNTFDQGEARANELVVEDKPVYCLQGNGIDRADTAGCNGKGVKEDVCYTLNTIDRPAVAYSNQAYDQWQENETSATLKATGGIYGGGSENLIVSEPQYIVRRLTPTECARLQGFPDRWGHPDVKDDFTDEEYRFWLDVRKTYDIINERKPKDYTRPQMVKWYSKLHVDASEYKMWGNGIALPTALYCMQGIAEALDNGGDEM